MSKKGICRLLILIAFMLLVVPMDTASAEEAEKNPSELGLKEASGKWIESTRTEKWWFKFSDGTYAKNEWILSDGKYYYFDESGWMAEDEYVYVKQYDSAGKETTNASTVAYWYVVKSYFDSEEGKIKGGWDESEYPYYWRRDSNVSKWWFGRKNSNKYFVKGKWATISQKKYNFDGDGYLRVNQWIPNEGVYVDKNGVLVENVMKLNSISVSAAKTTMTCLDEPLQLNVTWDPKESEEKLVYSSSNPEVATVDKNGKVTAVSEGKTKITVTSAYSTTVSGSIMITVEKALYFNSKAEPKLNMDTANDTLVLCEGFELKPNDYFISVDNATVSWKLSGSSLWARADGDLLRALNPEGSERSVTLIFTVKAGNKEREYPITVKVVPYNQSYDKDIAEIKIYKDKAGTQEYTGTETDPENRDLGDSGKIYVKLKDKNGTEITASKTEAVFWTGKGFVKLVTYFDDSTNVVTVDGDSCVFQKEGIGYFTVEMENGPQKTAYFEVGTKVYGWVTVDGKTYYYGNDGVKRTGWKQIDGKNYHFTAEGVMDTGWKIINGKKYHFNAKGVMDTGWKIINSKNYHFNEKGVLDTGWKKISGNWYYFKNDGQKAANEWCQGYWLNKNGTCTYSGKASWRKDKNGWYYMDTKGWYAKSSWQKIDSKWYYFNAKGYIVTGKQTIGGKTYTFDSNGVYQNQ